MARNKTISLAVEFKLKSKNINKFELLSRGSATLLKPKNKKEIRVLSTGHVLHPFKYPKYYPFDWLKLVGAGDLRYKFELVDNILNYDEHIDSKYNNQDLEFIPPRKKHILEPFFVTVKTHPTLDIGVLVYSLQQKRKYKTELEEYTFSKDMDPRLNNDFNLAKRFCRYFETFELSEEPMNRPEIFFHGHKVFERNGPIEKQILTYQLGESIKGRVFAFDQSRLFGKTNKELQMGMCGGAVEEDGKLKGIIEGIVNNGEGVSNELVGSAAFVPSQDIVDWCYSI
eukprot:snap_masked-scaffold_36-processed-gene-2.43-mRNA-1 protein AED:1.00 eAED:1.00 QI:0/-1/0/0/-1/1/1/0/283